MNKKKWNIITFAIVTMITLFTISVGVSEAISNSELKEKIEEVQDCIYINTYLPQIPMEQSFGFPIDIINVTNFRTKGFRPATDQYEINWLFSHRCVEIKKHTFQDKDIFVVEDYKNCEYNSTKIKQNVETLGTCYYELPEFKCRNDGCSNKEQKRFTCTVEENAETFTKRCIRIWNNRICWKVYDKIEVTMTKTVQGWINYAHSKGLTGFTKQEAINYLEANCDEKE